MLQFDTANHVYLFAGERMPSVTEVLYAEGLIDKTWYNDGARTRGDYVAKATAMYDRGVLNIAALDDRLRPYVNAWATCRLAMGWDKFRVIETPFYLPALRICGTPDRVWEQTVIDIKAGQPEDWHGLQLVPYGDAHNCTARVNVYLSADGKYRVVRRTDRGDRAAWMAAANLFNWKRNHGIKPAA